MKQIERYHERGYYVLYNPHSKKYFEKLTMSNLLTKVVLTLNMFKAANFDKRLNSIDYPELEGFVWREVQVSYKQTLVIDTET